MLKNAFNVTLYKKKLRIVFDMIALSFKCNATYLSLNCAKICNSLFVSDDT